jgi:hypothetical protein
MSFFADASQLGFNAKTLADWPSSANPGDVDDALNQLADRLADIDLSGDDRAVLKTNSSGTTAWVQVSAITDSLIYYDVSGSDWAGLAVSGSAAAPRIVGNVGSGITILSPLNVRDNFLVKDADDSTVTVTNSTSWTTAYSHALEGGFLANNGAVRFVVLGKYNNGSGSNARLKFRVTYGSTTMFQSGNGPALSSDSTDHAWMIVGHLASQSSESSQLLTGLYNLTYESNAPSSGYGGHEGTPVTGVFGGTASEDSSGQLTLDIELAHSAAHASLTWNSYFGAVLLA